MKHSRHSMSPEHSRSPSDDNDAEVDVIGEEGDDGFSETASGSGLKTKNSESGIKKSGVESSEDLRCGEISGERRLHREDSNAEEIEVSEFGVRNEIYVSQLRCMLLIDPINHSKTHRESSGKVK